MLRPRLSYANVISSLALFVALGGTGYAVTQLPRNSVGARQLKANAVTSAKIRPRAVQRSDLAPAARGGARGPRGPVGPAGPLGPSETIQVKRAEPVALPTAAGGSATIATITLSAGSWMFNAQTRIRADPGGSDYFNCLLVTAAGGRFADGALRVGGAAGDTLIGSIPSQGAMTFAGTTQVSYVCEHAVAIGGAPRAENSWLLATRVDSLENR
jgi:hypothetical protein